MKVLYQDTKEKLKKTKNVLRTDIRILKPGSEQSTSRRKVRCNNAVPTCYKTERSNKKLCSENNSVQNILSSSQQLHAVTTANIPFFPRLTMNAPAASRRNVLHISTASAPKSTERARNYVASRDVNVWTGPEGARRLGSQNFYTIGT